MSYTLYYSPGACSMAVHVLLNEVGAAVRLEKRSPMQGETRTPAFLKLNPRGQIPVLEENGTVIREGAAILVYLAEKYKSPLLPQGEGRAEALEWLMFGNATLHPAYSRCFWLLRQASEQSRNELMPKAVEAINTLWAEVESRLATHTYICGDKVTVADILLTVIANWSGNIPHPITIGSKTRALFKKIIARPAYQKALVAEAVEYKEAA